MAQFFEEEKIHILTKTNKVFSYSYTPGANLQSIIDLFKKTEKLPIEEIFIEVKKGQPMTPVTAQYNIE